MLPVGVCRRCTRSFIHARDNPRPNLLLVSSSGPANSFAMNLLVTGGSGFIGSHVLELLAEKPEVEKLVNLDCLTYAGSEENAKAVVDHPKYIFEEVNLRNPAEVVRVVHSHKITHVLHLAAESHVDRSIDRPNDFVTTNINGTFHLLEACKDLWEPGGDNRFVQVSTDEVFGSLGGDGAFTEDSPYAPNSPYSASKAAADMLVRSYVQTYGFPAIITNCTNNFGPRQFPEKLIPMTVQRLIERHEIPVYGSGEHVRDWIDVRDHAEALWAVLLGARAGETYNIGVRQELSNLELIGRLCDTFDELYPEAGGESRKLIKHVEDRPGHDRRYAIDPSKIGNELDWKGSRTIADGIRDTVRWYHEHQDWVQRAHFRITGQETDWESCYLSGDTQWDKGMPSPGLIDWLQDSPELKRGSVVVPGCGFGHDARAWAETGFKVVGHDIAPSAVRGGNERIKGSALNIEFQLGDFLGDEPTEKFDWVFEHTFFCAINPQRREDYLQAMLRWLKPDGQFLGVHYFIPDKAGPPFGTDREEIIERFSPHFELVKDWVPRSFPNRTNLERMFWWRRKTS